MIKLKVSECKITKEEKLSLLIEEAKRRGLVPGAKFSDPVNRNWYQIMGPLSYRKLEDSEIYFSITSKDDVISISVPTNKRGACIYYEGKWAELFDFKFGWEIPDKYSWDPYRNKYKT